MAVRRKPAIVAGSSSEDDPDRSGEGVDIVDCGSTIRYRPLTGLVARIVRGGPQPPVSGLPSPAGSIDTLISGPALTVDHMRVRDWQAILEDVVEADADPGSWRAVAGDRQSGIGEDLYLAHPGVGVYQLKTYAKNPFEVRGVGTRVARRVDEDLQPLFPEAAEGRFGVRSPIEDERQAERVGNQLESVVETHADAPTTPDDFFEDVMVALDSPAYGSLSYDQYDRSKPLETLTGTFEEAEDLLDAELDDLIDRDGVERGFQ